MRCLGFLNNLERLQSLGDVGSKMEDAMSRCSPIGFTSVVAVWIMRRNVRAGLELIEEAVTMVAGSGNSWSATYCRSPSNLFIICEI